MGFNLEALDKFLTEDEGVVENGFELDPSEDGKYLVGKNGKTVCSVEFLNRSTDSSEDLEVAQDAPENYDVVLTDIQDVALTDEYEQKLVAMGFENISR